MLAHVRGSIEEETVNKQETRALRRVRDVRSDLLEVPCMASPRFAMFLS